MTPRTRPLVAFALLVLLLTPVGAALAADHDAQDAQLNAGSSTSLAVTTSAAPTTVPATEAPTTAPATEPSTEPVTEPAATDPSTEAPTTAPVTAAPTTAPVTVPPTTKPRPAPTPAPTTTTPPPTAPPSAGPPVTLDAATAFKYAKAIIDANTPPPAPPATDPPAPDPTPAPAPSDNPLDQLSAADQGFLACVRWRESRNDYTVVNTSSGAGGAYQFMQSTWNITAAHLGRGDLIGLRPNDASPHDQDQVAVHLLQWYGRSPWGYSC